MEGAEQPPHDAHVYAVRDEAAYLQADEEKQPAPPEPLDPASILCQFCGKSWEQAPMLFQAKRRTMDPNTSAIVAVWICDECVAQLGQILAAEPPGTRGSVGGRLGPIPSDRSSADPAPDRAHAGAYGVVGPGGHAVRMCHPRATSGEHVRY